MQLIDLKLVNLVFDSLDNQLKDWIYNARLANIGVNDKELQIAIKGDAKKNISY
jgi:retron-type reverse transcriptase